MNISRLTGVLAMAAALLVAPGAHAGGPGTDVPNLGWRYYDDGDDESAQGLVDLGINLSGAGDAGQSIGAKKCVPRTSPITKHARIEYTDAAGLPTFTFFHDVTFTWNCKTVNLRGRSVRYTIYQPQYTFAGYVQNSTTPSGRAVVSSAAQGRFGICEQVAGTVCALERQPSITWKIDATGRATVKQTP